MWTINLILKLDSGTGTAPSQHILIVDCLTSIEKLAKMEERCPGDLIFYYKTRDCHVPWAIRFISLKPLIPTVDPGLSEFYGLRPEITLPAVRLPDDKAAGRSWDRIYIYEDLCIETF